MKKITLLFLSVFTGFLGLAQIETPAPSPTSTIQQMVGLTEVTVKYSRPSMRGRTVFGNLVPFGKIWRTGANANTTVTFSEEVTIAGQSLKSGTYAIFTKPASDYWEVYFYTDSNNWGTPQEWDDTKVAATARVPARPVLSATVRWLVPVETFTISLDNISNNGAGLAMYWENTSIEVPFEVPTKDQAMESIKRVMEGPSANDYFSAASYYYQEGLDMNTAKGRLKPLKNRWQLLKKQETLIMSR